MKPGEDPRELGRRRDLWLMPHSLKIMARILNHELERAAGGSVPGSQAGFTADDNAPAQTLVLRAQQERCAEERRDYYVGFVDFGTYFMSICKHVMRDVHAWAGVRPEVSEVLWAMQKELKGRYETAYGLTEAVTMDGVACGQGHECSPARSKLMTSVIQRLINRVGRGYRFGKES